VFIERGRPLKIRLVLGNWETQKFAAEPIRHEVFVVEQNVPVDMEWDEMDALSLHAIACDEGGEVVGTGRLLPDGHIGRMAVKASRRGAGVGSEILLALMQEAKKRGDRAVVLHAQIQAEPFYARFGFVREGREFMEADIPHICMRCCFDS
jgi:predicted GNAT family N-acyltransferase